MTTLEEWQKNMYPPKVDVEKLARQVEPYLTPPQESEEPLKVWVLVFVDEVCGQPTDVRAFYNESKADEIYKQDWFIDKFEVEVE